MSKNNCDTFYDTWERAPAIMKCWYRIAVVYRAVMILLLLAEIWIIAADLMASSPNIHPAPERHGIAALTGTFGAS